MTTTEEMTIGELGRTIARIEVKLERLVYDHEKRLRTLERWMWGAAGTGAVGAATGAAAFLVGPL